MQKIKKIQHGVLTLKDLTNESRAVTILLSSDTICIVIRINRYNTYHNISVFMKCSLEVKCLQKLYKKMNLNVIELCLFECGLPTYQGVSFADFRADYRTLSKLKNV